MRPYSASEGFAIGNTDDTGRTGDERPRTGGYLGDNGVIERGFSLLVRNGVHSIKLVDSCCPRHLCWAVDGTRAGTPLDSAAGTSHDITNHVCRIREVHYTAGVEDGRKMNNVEYLEDCLGNLMETVVLDVPKVEDVAVCNHVLGIDQKLRPVMIVLGVLLHEDRDDLITVHNELPRPPNGTAASVSSTISLTDVACHLGAGGSPAKTWTTSASIGNKTLHQTLHVGAVLVRAIQPLCAGSCHASLGGETYVALHGTTPGVPHHDLHIVHNVGGVDLNTLRFVGELVLRLELVGSSDPLQSILDLKSKH